VYGSHCSVLSSSACLVLLLLDLAHYLTFPYYCRHLLGKVELHRGQYAWPTTTTNLHVPLLSLPLLPAINLSLRTLWPLRCEALVGVWRQPPRCRRVIGPISRSPFLFASVTHRHRLATRGTTDYQLPAASGSLPPLSLSGSPVGTG